MTLSSVVLRIYLVWWWLNFTHTALFDRVKWTAYRPIMLSPTECLLTLKFCRSVVYPSIFYFHFHACCSPELVKCMSPPLQRPGLLHSLTQPIFSSPQLTTVHVKYIWYYALVVVAYQKPLSVSLYSPHCFFFLLYHRAQLKVKNKSNEKKPATPACP